MPFWLLQLLLGRRFCLKKTSDGTVTLAPWTCSPSTCWEQMACLHQLPSCSAQLPSQAASPAAQPSCPARLPASYDNRNACIHLEIKSLPMSPLALAKLLPSSSSSKIFCKDWCWQDSSCDTRDGPTATETCVIQYATMYRYQLCQPS